MVEPDWDRAQPEAARRVWEAVLVPLATDLAARAEALSIEVVGEITRGLPELFADPEAAEENRASTEANIRALADLIRRGGDPYAIQLPAPTLSYAREGAQRGIPVGALLRSYRLGHAAIWQTLTRELAARSADRDELADAVDLCSAWVFAYADVAQSLAEEFYAAERERWLRSAAASRAETIEAILDGRQRDAVVASGRLRYDLDRAHLGVVAWMGAAPDDADPMAALEGAVAQLVSVTGADGSLVQPLGRLSIAGWLSARTALNAEALDRVRLDAGPGADGTAVRVAAGEAARGIAGFRETHEEALNARRVAVLARRPPGSVTRYGRVALSAMATADPEQARTFVRRELGELAATDDTSLRLAATVRAYLDEQANRSRTAKRLGVHENTITYRIRQAEGILGRTVDERSLELRVALALANVVRDRDPES